MRLRIPKRSGFSPGVHELAELVRRNVSDEGHVLLRPWCTGASTAKLANPKP